MIKNNTIRPTWKMLLKFFEELSKIEISIDAIVSY